MASAQAPKQSIDKLMAKHGISNDQRKMVQNVVLLHALMEVKSQATKRLAELGIECLAAMNRAIDNDVLDIVHLLRQIKNVPVVSITKEELKQAVFVTTLIGDPLDATPAWRKAKQILAEEDPLTLTLTLTLTQL